MGSLREFRVSELEILRLWNMKTSLVRREGPQRLPVTGWAALR